jgi:hypothetical protein
MYKSLNNIILCVPDKSYSSVVHTKLDILFIVKYINNALYTIEYAYWRLYYRLYVWRPWMF